MIDFNIDNYLRISWQDVLLVCISSLLIVLFCKHFFWDKLLAFIDKRQKLIQNNIDSSEQLKAEALKEKQAYDAQLASAGSKANAIIDQAKREAKAEKEQILAEARSQADNIGRAAQEEIERDRLRAAGEMKDAITDVALAAAGQILGAEIDADKQKKILDDLIDEAGEGKW
ncbi:F0F1 ATP synthase subunit B [Allobaculum mucilyticum]|uniref:F0F1 ATP synthase subunit B n=1 Tax=Allobaculum mucilyticum TaxID=2834459 RepID=UPI001E35F932|nr:F0F1 ATP synthase subunit B [Allobaculum mucilyticum]UNT95503.1 F0F1 ATP synthase subunit B [Allobaculum mucilyticum]